MPRFRRSIVFVNAILFFFCLSYSQVFAVKSPLLPTKPDKFLRWDEKDHYKSIKLSSRINSIWLEVWKALDEEKYKPDDILILLDIDETLITSFIRRRGKKIYLTAANIAKFIFKQVLENNIKRILDHLITYGLLQANSAQAEILKNQLNGALRFQAVNIKNGVMLQLNKLKKLEFELVERNTAKFRRELQERGIRFMRLTARGWQMRHETDAQLRSVGIYLHKNTIWDKTYIFDFGGFHRGTLSLTLYSGITTKGALLCQFFKCIGYTPRKVIYVDDNFGWGRELWDAVSIEFPSANVYCIGYDRVDQPVVADEIIRELIEGCCGESWWVIPDEFIKPFVINAYKYVLDYFWSA